MGGNFLVGVWLECGVNHIFSKNRKCWQQSVGAEGDVRGGMSLPFSFSPFSLFIYDETWRRHARTRDDKGQGAW